MIYTSDVFKSMCLIFIITNILHVSRMEYKNNFHVGIHSILFLSSTCLIISSYKTYVSYIYLKIINI